MVRIMLLQPKLKHKFMCKKLLSQNPQLELNHPKYSPRQHAFLKRCCRLLKRQKRQKQSKWRRNRKKVTKKLSPQRHKIESVALITSVLKLNL
jgi:hypothetical protein